MNSFDVVRHRDTDDLLLGEGAQEIPVRTECCQPADVAVENSPTLLVREWELRDSRARVLLHPIAKRRILAQQLRDLVNSVNAHCSSIPAPHAVRVAMFHLRLEEDWFSGADHAQHGDPVQ